MGERWFRQEYECSFEDAVEACFRQEDIETAAGLAMVIRPWTH
jgi:hypothetical protein